MKNFSLIKNFAENIFANNGHGRNWRKFSPGENFCVYGISDYKACDELKDAVMELKNKKRELEAEMKRVAISNRQSRWYFHKKSGEGIPSNSKLSGSSSASSESPLAYESSTDTASSNESMIGSEGSSVPLTVAESPASQKPNSRAGSVSPVFGTSRKPHSRAGSVIGSSENPQSKSRSVSPVFHSTQKPQSRGGSTPLVTQKKREPVGVKLGECSRGSVARSSISSSPQSPDTCAVLTQKSTEIPSSQPESPDCTKITSDELDDCIVLSESEQVLSQLRHSRSPELDISLIGSSNSSPTTALSQFPLFSQPEPSQGHHSDSSDSLPFSPSLPAAQQQL